MSDARTLGESFAEAFVAKEESAVARLLDAEIDFQALTPNRTWAAKGPDRVLSDVVRPWIADFEDGAELVEVSSHSFAGTESVTYRFAGRDEEGPFVCEQHAYVTGYGNRIKWMRVVCSGFVDPKDG
jgi:hypothetical protein